MYNKIIPKFHLNENVEIRLHTGSKWEKGVVNYYNELYPENFFVIAENLGEVQIELETDYMKFIKKEFS